jgi:hypothetical protein
VIQKNEENKSCRKTLHLKVWFSSFMVHNSSKEATALARNGPKFPCGFKLEASTVFPPSYKIYCVHELKVNGRSWRSL